MLRQTFKVFTKGDKQMIDLGRLKVYLRKHGELRDEAEIKTARVERIQPLYTDEWPARLESSVPKAIVNAGIPMLHQKQADAISTWGCHP